MNLFHKKKLVVFATKTTLTLYACLEGKEAKLSFIEEKQYDESTIQPILDEIKKNYPFPYKIVDQKEIDNAMLNSKSDIAVMKFLPPFAGPFLFVIDCSNGKILSYFLKSTGVGYTAEDFKPYHISKKMLKKLSNF